VRVTQCTLSGALEVLGRYVEATGAVESSRKFHRVVWKFSNTTDAGDPILMTDRPVESMLLEPPNQLLLLVALGGPIGPVGWSCWSDRGCGIQWKFHRGVWKNILPIRLVLRGLSILPATAVAAAVAPPQWIRIDTVGLGDRSGCLCRGSESIRMEDEVSFFLKDTPMDPDRSRITWSLLSCVTYKSTIIFLPNRSNQFELFLVHVGCTYPVGCRDLCVC